MSNARIIAESLDIHKMGNDGWYNCCCPIHEDKRPSMGVKDGEKGSVIFNCLAGCDSKDIAEHFKGKGFHVDRIKEEYVETSNQPVKKQHREVCRYPYISVDGELLFEKIRYEPKSFFIVNPTGNGMNGHGGALYGAQYMKDAAGKTVYIVEGEKDVDFLTALSFIAVTSGSASHWPEKNNDLFRGVNVRIIPDNDKAGLAYEEKVRASLKGIANSIKTAHVPDIYNDVSEWECEAKDITSLFEVHAFKTISFADILNLEVKTDWIIKDWIEPHSLIQVFGASGSGKSFFSLDMAYCVASGTNFFGKTTKKGNVLYIAGEGHSGFTKRAKALQDKYNATVECFEFSMQAAEILSEDSCVQVQERILDNSGGFDLIFIDTMNRNFGMGDENSTKDMSAFVANVDKYFRSTGAAVIIVHHTGLQNPDRARGSGSVYAALNTEFKIEKDEQHNMTVTCTKQKEGESLWTKELLLKPVVVGYDEIEKEDVFSCVITDLDVAEEDKSGLCDRDKIVLNALQQCAIEDGDELILEGDITVYTVLEDEWRECAFRHLKSKNKRRDFVTSKNKVIESGLVFCSENRFYIL